VITLPRLTLRLRLSISIIAIVTLFTLTNITYQLSSENRNLRLDNLQNAVAGQLASVTIRQQMEDRQKEILVLDALKDSNDEKLSGKEVKQGLAALDALDLAMQQLQSYVYDDTSNGYQELQASQQELQQHWRQFYSGYNRGKTPPTQKIENAFSHAMQQLSELEALEIQAAEQQTSELQKTVRITDRITLAIYLFTIALTISLGYLLIRYTNRSLKELNVGTVRVGSGDLNYHIPVNNDDEIGDLAIAFNEMSDKLHNAMAQVQQSKEKADQANRAKTNFLANMSHELRTPLNAIIGYSEMILEDYREEKALDEQQAIEDLQRILSSGRHLLQLINDVLDLAKIESGNMTVFNENFNSVEIIEELLRTMSAIAKKNGNVLFLEQSKIVPRLYNDAVKFRQLFLNLLSNACKFTEQGRITVLITYHEKKQQVIYHVSDTGIGMTPSQLKRVFEAFVQADSSTSKKYGGTGLGLSLCKQFVELMNGRMDVASAEGQGTTFTVVLPITAEKVSRHSTIPMENQQELVLPLDSGNKGKISTATAEQKLGTLIISADKESRNQLQRQLLEKEHRCFAADNFEQGIELAQSTQPKNIALELMGNGDGWQLMSALKKSQQTQHIPVLLHLSQQNGDSNGGGDKNSTLAQELCTADELPRMTSVLRRLNPRDRRGTALLISQKSEARQQLLDELSNEAWQCTTTASASQVRKWIQQKTPDVILLGIGLPAEKIAEIIQQLVQLAGASHHPIAPVYLIDEHSPYDSHNKRLDLPADQLLL